MWPELICSKSFMFIFELTHSLKGSRVNFYRLNPISNQKDKTSWKNMTWFIWPMRHISFHLSWVTSVFTMNSYQLLTGREQSKLYLHCNKLKDRLLSTLVRKWCVRRIIPPCFLVRRNLLLYNLLIRGGGFLIFPPSP